MEENQERELKKIQFRKIRTVIVILILALVLGAVAFTYFHISTQARIVFREAKNVKLALDMLDIEYSTTNKSVYNGARRSGMEKGVEQQIYNVVQQPGEIQILSYDKEKRKILSMTYEEEHFRVTYSYDETKGDGWRVDYIMTVFDYSK